MTLGELIPSLRPALRAKLAAGIWPQGTTLDSDGELHVGGSAMTRVAARFGTPAYVLDEATFRRRARQYRAALPGVEVCYAGKALLTRAVARWVAQEGLSLDVCSAGELAVARSVHFPADRLILHGNAKTPEDLKAALDYHVGRIVIDSTDEISHLGPLAHDQRVLLRVTPDVDGHTHHAISTGVPDQKFGIPLGAATDAAGQVLDQPGLRLVGLHCHIGSQLTRIGAIEEATRRLIGLLATIRDQHGIVLAQLNIGGGHAVRYTPGDDGFDLAGLAHRLTGALAYESERHRLPAPRLTVEPGRALIAQAGITLYRVITVKHLPGVRTFVAVDGGMSDNPRPALYGARYTLQLIGRRSLAASHPATVVGRHCEAGDILARDVPLPGDIHAGDLLAVATTGAYHHSLASTYNLVGRPPLVAVHDGTARLLIRRETEEDLLTRDIGV
ncbi:diaminopimelate decarboxylase [Pseudofrankia inefficax]|uniref:Diaminopimelate decarboxylase n=1 Tax=Pseudofrankia inefficax (strain DSM 45817 / CECT 9037 / DDB 130130 / EuI1c) TaxID=298654 RepID=E3IZQ9_PSEI1|nr:diaminopimelate decarboxylase [Pseudofrankia inefficax]ADP83977.1 diaminopimelate decarboxylase [Pseudofrankia inefficax]